MSAALPDELIGQLYDASIDPLRWTGIAQQIASAFDSTSAVIKFHGQSGDVQLLQTTDNMVVPARLNDWAEDWHRRDLWVQRSIRHGLDTIVTDEILVTPEEQAGSGYYTEFLAHFDIHHMVGAVFGVGEGGVGVLGIHRPEGAASFDDADRGKAAQFLPHLRRSLQLSRRLSQAGLLKTAALEALDHIDTGVIVIDPHGRVMHTNAHADALIQASAEFGIAQHRFFLTDSRLNERFIQSLRHVLDTAANRGGHKLPSAFCIHRANHLPVTLSIAPLRPGWSRGFDPGALALIFLKNPEQSYQVQWLRDLFDLTATEAVIAADLGSGKSLDRIAQRHAIAIGTVRFHLKRIFAKTGTERQAETAALIARSVAALEKRP